MCNQCMASRFPSDFVLATISMPSPADILSVPIAIAHVPSAPLCHSHSSKKGNKSDVAPVRPGKRLCNLVGRLEDAACHRAG